MTIQKVAVLGSGVMGSSIAAVCANAGLEVILLDIVPKGAEDRNALAKGAIEKQLKSNPPGFAHKRNAKKVTPGNLEDDLEKLSECDWVCEVVLEDMKVKHDVYATICPHMKTKAVLSSNTSTIPLHELAKGVPDSHKSRFLITHFFNPPRFLPLLELTGGESCEPAVVNQMAEFLDKALGRGVVRCKDTPGFLGNRIGVFWLLAGLNEALRLNINIEDADAVMGRPVGIPKTGVFGLFDLIGIDLMPHIGKSMLMSLPKHDRFREIYDEPKLVTEMIADGYTGRKGKGGFYRLNREGGKKVKEAKDLATGEYTEAKKSKLASVAKAKEGLRALVEADDIGGEYAKAVLVQTLHYAASLVPEISDDILNIDEAMRLGYNWKYGPFELIDRLSTQDEAGADWLARACEEAGLTVPPLLKAASGKTFYKEEGSERLFLTLQGDYQPIHVPEGAWLLKDISRGQKPITKNGAAKLWDIGDGIACLEFTTKANSIDPELLDMLQRSIDIVRSDFKGLVIGNDADRFSVGANIGFFMYVANLAAWKQLSDVIRQGQNTYMALKYAPFPVVSATTGFAFGGGCELMLHSDAVQAHIETYPGLVEAGIGVIPGWGGCKEMLVRHFALQDYSQGQIMLGKQPKPFMPNGSMPAVMKAFEYIGMAKVAGSAQEARDLLILNEKSGITMNRRRVLADAKERCLTLSENYTPPEPPIFSLPGASGKAALMMALEGYRDQGKATPHDMVVGEALATVLTGGNCQPTDELTEQHVLDLEHDLFMQLVKTEGTMARIEHMLETNKPLRN
jgi:3-hydroxyacyl-CoA dehydrogenase